ncbi:uncharacterized protein [Acropora muricata]|uniref:uncharacterized protein n=1 Tax=Acropora muricata TaxID=159855 RepID=UPI0034E51A4A
MFPDQTKREKAEKRIQSARNRSLTRTNLNQKRPAASRKKQPKEKNELSTIKAKLNELTTLMNVFSKSENKTRVAFYPRVSSTDSCRANPARPASHSKKRRQKRKALINQYKQNNDRYIMNLSDTTLTDQDKTLLSKGLKFIPTPPKPNSHRSLIKDFNNFTRNMRLKFLFADCNSKPHPFHVKSNWQPPPQPSVALENYLERTKYEIATISFCDTQDNLSTKEREALKKLCANTKQNIRKAHKGNTTVVMDTQRKITEGSDQVYDTNYYTPLKEPIVASTANKVKLIVNKLYVNKHIDEMTFKWLNNIQNPPRIPEFYTLTKIHKPNLADRPIVSGNGGPTERISSFIDSFLQPIAKKQESYIKDTTDFVRFIENTPIPENAIIATLDVCSVYTNIPQEEGLKVVCKYVTLHGKTFTNDLPLNGLKH